MRADRVGLIGLWDVVLLDVVLLDVVVGWLVWLGWLGWVDGVDGGGWGGWIHRVVGWVVGTSDEGRHACSMRWERVGMRPGTASWDSDESCVRRANAIRRVAVTS